MKRRFSFSPQTKPSTRNNIDIRWLILPGIALIFAGIFGLLDISGTPPSNDDRENAIEITDLNNWCSADAAYTTSDATSDESEGSCWGAGPNYNVWFKFQATSKDVTIQLKTGSSEGTLRNPYITLWDSTGSEISCAVYNATYADMTISSNSLTVGKWYFISVDNHSGYSGAYQGTFSLCVNAGLDYDWKEGAEELSDLSNWCSADAAYTTLWGSADESAGSCWGAGPNYNRWFKFQATSEDVTIQVKTGSSEGTLRNPYITLWDSTGTEISCAVYNATYADMTISSNSLTVGKWYFISVDNHSGYSGAYRGTFTLCVNAGLDYDWKEAAEELSDLNDWCSADAAYTTLWASADESAGSCWGAGPNYNRWFKFQATNEDVTIQVKTGSSEGTLRNPYITLWDSTGTEISCAVYNATYADMTISSNSLTVGKWYFISVDNHSGYSGAYRGTFTLCVNAGLDYDWKEAAEELSDLNDWCSADAAYTTLWASADESAGSCWGAGPNYNRWFKFQATNEDVTIQVKTGSSEGTLRNPYITLWDSTGTEISCAVYNATYADMTISSNSLTVGKWYFISVDNHSGYSGAYRGTFTLCVNAGLDYDWKEAAEELSDLNDWTSADAAYTTLWASSDESAGSCWGAGPTYNRWFTFVASNEDIEIEMLTGSSQGTLRNGYLTLWDSLGNELACDKYSSTYDDLLVQSAGLTPGDRYYISVDNHSGYSGAYRGTFSMSIDATVSLPIELLEFEGQVEGNTVRLHWSTSQEENNDFFTIERSVDGLIFEALGQVPGSGTVSSLQEYQFVDPFPLGGRNIYRLKQTDFDGTSSYSHRVELSFEAVRSISEFSVFPNPFSDHFSVSFIASEESQAILELLDIKGNVIARKSAKTMGGRNRIQWPIGQDLQPGIFVLQLRIMNQDVQSLKLIHR